MGNNSKKKKRFMTNQETKNKYAKPQPTTAMTYKIMTCYKKIQMSGDKRVKFSTLEYQSEEKYEFV